MDTAPAETIQTTIDVDLAECGFNMEAFNLDHETRNLLEGNLTQEGVQTQLAKFLEEYLTPLTQSQFDYYISGGKLISKGWQEPMEASYRKAPLEIGITPQQKEVREAELASFMQIQQFLIYNLEIGNYQAKAYLQSPAENYNSPYSFVSQYEIVPINYLNENKQWVNEYIIKATNHRVIGLPFTQHHRVRQAWVERLNVEGETNPQTPTEALAAALLSMDNQTTFDEMLQDYYIDCSPMQNLKEQDTLVGQALQNFQPEIDRLAQDITEQAAQYDQGDREDLIRKFKLFLIKAKVHFDRDAAIREWGETNVGQVESTIQLQSKPQPLEETSFEKIYNSMLNLTVHINGSCGSIGDNKLSIGQITKSLLHSNFEVFTKSIERPDESECPHCHVVFYVKNGDSSSYQEDCPACGKNIECK